MRALSELVPEIWQSWSYRLLLLPSLWSPCDCRPDDGCYEQASNQLASLTSRWWPGNYKMNQNPYRCWRRERRGICQVESFARHVCLCRYFASWRERGRHVSYFIFHVHVSKKLEQRMIQDLALSGNNNSGIQDRPEGTILLCSVSYPSFHHMPMNEPIGLSWTIYPFLYPPFSLGYCRKEDHLCPFLSPFELWKQQIHTCTCKRVDNKLQQRYGTLPCLLPNSRVESRKVEFAAIHHLSPSVSYIAYIPAVCHGEGRTRWY